VHRPPPQAGRSNGNHSSPRSANQPQRRANQHHRQPRMDGNAMYLGAMAFPADLMDAQGMLSLSLCVRRYDLYLTAVFKTFSYMQEVCAIY